MLQPLLPILVAAILHAMGVAVHADMVILRSGEMFETRKAWRQDGSVCFYRNGRIVRYPESDVERLIETNVPVTDKPSTTDRPAPAPKPVAPQLPIQGDTGYLGLKWEQSSSQIKGLRSAGTDAAYGGVQLYTIGKNRNRFGRASVDNVFLGFWQGGL
jgi:hypothetical protein